MTEGLLPLVVATTSLWLLALAMKTAHTYIARGIVMHTIGSTRAVVLAMAIVLVALGLGIEQFFWLLVPLIKLTGGDVSWWQSGVKGLMVPLQLVACAGYVLHEKAAQADSDQPNRWIAGSITWFLLSCTTVLSLWLWGNFYAPAN